jgi:hypothetical protein
MVDHVTICGHKLSRRTRSPPKIGKILHQKSPREDIQLKIGMITRSTYKRYIRILPPRMDACKI